MKRARATIEARNPRVPIGCMSPRSRQPSSGAASSQADVVLEHVRRRVDLDVQRPPERDPHRGAVGGVGGPAVTTRRRRGAAGRAAWRLQIRPSGSRTVISRVP